VAKLCSINALNNNNNNNNNNNTIPCHQATFNASIYNQQNKSILILQCIKTSNMNTHYYTSSAAADTTITTTTFGFCLTTIPLLVYYNYTFVLEAEPLGFA